MHFFSTDPTRKLLVSRHTFTHHYDCRDGDETQPRFKDKYELCEKLSGLPRTYKCILKATNDARTVKIVPRSLEKSFWEELCIYKAMESGYFPRIFESFEDETHLFFVFERIDNMFNLLDAVHQVAQVKRYSEKDVASVVKIVLEGLEYSHKLPVNTPEGTQYVSVSHGQISPKNIMVDINPENPEKILYTYLLVNLEAASVQFHTQNDNGTPRNSTVNPTDLKDDAAAAILALASENSPRMDGSSSSYSNLSDDGTEETTPKNDPALKARRRQSHFHSPEYSEQGATPKGDIYSLGVLAYYLITGTYPFHTAPQPGATNPPNEIDFSGVQCPDLKRFIRHALHMDPHKRPSATRALHNDHYDMKNIYTEEELEEMVDKENEISHEAMERLTHTRKRNKLQDAVAYYIANYLSFDDNEAKEDDDDKSRDQDMMIHLATTFHSMDTNNDGVLTEQELKNSLVGVLDMHLSDKEIKDVMKRMDMDQNGTVDLKEFLATAADTARILSEQKLRAAFTEFDISQTGFITVEDLKSFFNHDGDEKVLSTKAARAMIAKADKAKDGQLSFEEFKTMMWECSQDNSKSKNNKKDNDKNDKDSAKDLVRRAELARDFSERMRFKRNQHLAGVR